MSAKIFVDQLYYRTPDGSTKQLFDDDKQGIILPSGDTASRPTSPTLGTSRMNSETNVEETWNGTEWVATTSGGGSQTVLPKSASEIYNVVASTKTTRSVDVSESGHNRTIQYIKATGTLMLIRHGSSYSFSNLVYSKDGGLTWLQNNFSTANRQYHSYINHSTGDFMLKAVNDFTWVGNDAAGALTSVSTTLWRGPDSNAYTVSIWDPVRNLVHMFSATYHTTTSDFTAKTSAETLTVGMNTATSQHVSKDTQKFSVTLGKLMLHVNNGVVFSDDGINWTYQEISPGSMVHHLYELNGKLYAMSADTNIRSSEDGINWTVVGKFPVGMSNASVYSCKEYNGTLFANFLFNDGMFTTDGINWFPLPATSAYTASDAAIIDDGANVILLGYASGTEIDFIQTSR